MRYRQRQKLNKFALDLKSILARPPIYDPACPEMFSTASPGNAVGFTDPSFFYCLFNRIKSLWKSRQVLRELILRQVSAVNTWQKIARSRYLHQNSVFYKLLKLLLNLGDMYHFEARWKRQILGNAEIHLENFSGQKNFRPETCGKITKSAKNWLQPTLHNPSPNQYWDAIYGILCQRSVTK